jgi:hypothetical protein
MWPEDGETQPFVWSFGDKYVNISLVGNLKNGEENISNIRGD